MAYLRHKSTGDIYPMSEHLMRRGDMEVVEDLAKVEEVVEDAPVVKPKATRKKKAAPVEDVVEDAPAEDELEGDPLDADLLDGLDDFE